MKDAHLMKAVFFLLFYSLFNFIKIMVLLRFLIISVISSAKHHAAANVGVLS